MTPTELRELVAATGRSRRELARLLGYRSEVSLRQAESGRQKLSLDKVEWLEGYSKVRVRLARLESRWLKKNPPPSS